MTIFVDHTEKYDNNDDTKKNYQSRGDSINSPTPAHTRQHLHFIHEEQSLTYTVLNKALESLVFNRDKKTWMAFIKVLLLSLGVGSFVIGMIFFFAYNWADLHKFIKFAFAQGFFVLMLLTTLFASRSVSIKTEQRTLIRNICLMGASVTVGGMFALFGQVYQSTADAYTLFLVWAVCITPFVWIARFAPLWLLWIVLINVTVSLFISQTNSFEFMTTCLFLFVINGFFATLSLSYRRKNPLQAQHEHDNKKTSTSALTLDSTALRIPQWFVNILILASVGYATVGSCFAVFDLFYYSHDDDIQSILIICTTAISYVLAVTYAMKHKILLIPALVYFSAMVIGCFFIFGLFEVGGFFIAPVFVITALVLSMKEIIRLRKKWQGSSQQSSNTIHKELVNTENNKTKEKANDQRRYEPNSDESNIACFNQTLDAVTVLDENEADIETTVISNSVKKERLRIAYTGSLAEKSLLITLLSFFGGVFASCILMLFFAFWLSDSSINFLFLAGFLFTIAIICDRSVKEANLAGISSSFYTVAMGLVYYALTDGIIDSKVIVHVLLAIVAVVIFPWLKSKLLHFLSFMTIYVNAVFFVLLLFHNSFFDSSTSLMSVFDSYGYDDYNASAFNWLSVFAILSLATMAVAIALLIQEARALTTHRFIKRHYQTLQTTAMVSFLSSMLIISELEQKTSLSINELLCVDGFSWSLLSVNLFMTIGITALIVFLLSKFYHNLAVINKTQYLLLTIALTLSLLTTFSYPLLSASILLLLAAFYVNDRLWRSIAIIVFVYAVSRYYYSLNTTLLIKSIAMMISGAFMIATYHLVERVGTITNPTQKNTLETDSNDHMESK